MKILVAQIMPWARTIGEKIEYEGALALLRGIPEAYKGMEITKRELPMEFQKSQELMLKWLAEGYDRVFCLGPGSGLKQFTVERVAINLMDAWTADQAGYCPQEEPVVPGGPDGCFTNLPIKQVTENLRKQGMPVWLSQTAGIYVCNAVFYRMLYEIKERQLPIKAGFFHLPKITTDFEASYGTMTLEEGLWTLLGLIEGFGEQ